MARKQQVTNSTIKKICEYLCNGDSMVTVARKIGVTRGTIYRWVSRNDKYQEMLKEAREVQSHNMMDELVTIADDDSRDLITDATGRKYANAAAVARDKLKIDTRRRLSGFHNPKAYSDQAKIDITSNGESVSNFGGLVITPPKDESEETAEDKEEE